MRNELRQLELYLDQTLGTKIILSPWPDSKRLAPFLRQLYGFWQTKIMGTPCLLMVDEGHDEQAAVVIGKHLAQVRAKWDGEMVYVRNHLTPYNRKRLLELKIPFVVPSNQMYLPMVGVDFRERFRRPLDVPVKFSPATQVTVLYWLLKGTDQPLTPTQTAQHLGYSTMSTTRAFTELEATELVEVDRRGKERLLTFIGAKRDIWVKAQPFLRTPVTKRIYIRQQQSRPECIQAGLDALTHYSMLAAPARPVVAVYGQDWKASPRWHDKASIPSQDPEAFEIEVWRYRPDLLAREGVVDPLSLYLSLRDNQDERVQAALEEMIGRIEW